MGDVVRTSLDHLGRIVAFDNTWSHVRGGRIVHLAAVGPGYTDAKGRFTAWEEDLCAACPYDRFGRHPHFPECGCGLELEIHGAWTAAPASWQVGATRCEQEEIPLTRRRLP